ncbi:hypothetical protein TNCV_3252311 [Trichonephila clavipes]|nr:hypothetical protein TNCV_3252311 [Trichonephila clavipes]
MLSLYPANQYLKSILKYSEPRSSDKNGTPVVLPPNVHITLTGVLSASKDFAYERVTLTSHCLATRGLLTTDLVILNLRQVMMTPELAPLYHGGSSVPLGLEPAAHKFATHNYYATSATKFSMLYPLNTARFQWSEVSNPG